MTLFRSQGIAFAVMGGLALNFRGSVRDTHDVDITAACDMHTLRAACNSSPRCASLVLEFPEMRE